MSRILLEAHHEQCTHTVIGPNSKPISTTLPGNPPETKWNKSYTATSLTIIVYRAL